MKFTLCSERKLATCLLVNDVHHRVNASVRTTQRNAKFELYEGVRHDRCETHDHIIQPHTDINQSIILSHTVQFLNTLGNYIH
jgi:hypothetical protein